MYASSSIRYKILQQLYKDNSDGLSTGLQRQFNSIELQKYLDKWGTSMPLTAVEELIERLTLVSPQKQQSASKQIRLSRICKPTNKRIKLYIQRGNISTRLRQTTDAISLQVGTLLEKRQMQYLFSQRFLATFFFSSYSILLVNLVQSNYLSILIQTLTVLSMSLIRSSLSRLN